LGSTNFSEYQSGYRTGHSTETALLEVLDSVYTAADDKQLSVIIGFDLSHISGTKKANLGILRIDDIKVCMRFAKSLI